MFIKFNSDSETLKHVPSYSYDFRRESMTVFVAEPHLGSFNGRGRIESFEHLRFCEAMVWSHLCRGGDVAERVWSLGVHR